MKWIRVLLPAGFVLGLLAGITAAMPAQEEEETHYWYVSYYKFPWEYADSLRKLVRTYSYPAWEEAKKSDKLLDYKVMIHQTGDEFNALVMWKYASWDAMDDGVLGEAFRTVFPDSVQRAEINDAFREIWGAWEHRDQIWVEIEPE